VLVRVSLPRYTKHSSGYFFAPAGHRLNVFSQAPGASRSQHRLSSFLLTKYGSRGRNAVGFANPNDHRPTNTRNCFSAPEAVLNEVEQRFDCVQAQTHMYPSLVGVFTLILNRIPLGEHRRDNYDWEYPFCTFQLPIPSTFPKEL